jgi:four helix bundle protein
MRRTVVSVPSNLVEGAGRKGTKEFQQFLNIAQGSISELDTQVELDLMLGYIGADQHEGLNSELTVILKMLYGLSRSLTS